MNKKKYPHIEGSAGIFGLVAFLLFGLAISAGILNSCREEVRPLEDEIVKQ